MSDTIQVSSLKMGGVLSDPKAFTQQIDIYAPDVKNINGLSDGWNPTNTSLSLAQDSLRESKLILEVTKEQIAKRSHSLTQGVKDMAAEVQNFASAQIATAEATIAEARSKVAGFADDVTGVVDDKLGTDLTGGVNNFLSKAEQATKDLLDATGVGYLVGDFGNDFISAINNNSVGGLQSTLDKLKAVNIANLVNGIKGVVCVPVPNMDGINDSMNGTVIDMGMNIGLDGLLECMETMFKNRDAYFKAIVKGVGPAVVRGNINMLDSACRIVGGEGVVAANHDIIKKTLDNLVGDKVPDMIFGKDKNQRLLAVPPDTNPLAAKRTYLINTLNAADPDWLFKDGKYNLNNLSSVSDDAKALILSNPTSKEAIALTMAEVYNKDVQKLHVKLGNVTIGTDDPRVTIMA